MPHRRAPLVQRRPSLNAVEPSPPPDEVFFTARVGQQLATLNGRHDPLGDRLPFTTYYREHLSVTKQQRLLELVRASVPRCIARDAELRKRDGVQMDLEIREATSDAAQRAQAARQPVDIDIERLETRAEAVRREVRRETFFD